MTNNIAYTDGEAYQECSENMPMANPPGGGEAPGGNGVGEAVTIEVSVAANSNGAGNVYVINNTQNSTLGFVHGNTYTLNHPNAHPLRFSTTPDGTHGGGVEYGEGVTLNDGSTVIEVTANTPATLYYYCSIHAGMGGQINVTQN